MNKQMEMNTYYAGRRFCRKIIHFTLRVKKSNNLYSFYPKCGLKCDGKMLQTGKEGMYIVYDSEDKHSLR